MSILAGREHLQIRPACTIMGGKARRPEGRRGEGCQVTEASWARPQDRDEIVDFCDLVFSKAHCPHDFTTLLPKL